MTRTERLGLKKSELNTSLLERHENEIYNIETVDRSVALFATGSAFDRPAAGITGRFYFASDTKKLYFDTGSEWLTIY